ncbi:hypothetical protein A7K92_16855 [Klebsiella pneumoniae]|nr:hypothetical protein A7K92_16855 [Klebsiella pneumoniae]
MGSFFGGKSAEHEVSLQSAKNIVEAIDKSRFDVVLLGKYYGSQAAVSHGMLCPLMLSGWKLKWQR